MSRAAGAGSAWREANRGDGPRAGASAPGLAIAPSWHAARLMEPTMLGERLGNYLVTGKVGEGGMGTVYAAQHVLPGRQAAIRVLLPALSSTQDRIERFFDEARATAAIRRPGIVEIYDLGCHADGSAYIAMELLPGHSLALRIARGPPPVLDALQIARQIAAAL